MQRAPKGFVAALMNSIAEAGSGQCEEVQQRGVRSFMANVSTARTRITGPGGSVYASMKGAVEVLSKHMAKELGPRRIAVNVVAPGATETDFSGGIVRDNLP
jgi:NAD(P)-dependent dehydrogenase (short-subunit alcohol dehydrogenase family)